MMETYLKRAIEIACRNKSIFDTYDYLHTELGMSDVEIESIGYGAYIPTIDSMR